MSIRKWKLASIFLWCGAGVTLLGVVLAYPRLAPFVETYLYTSRIATAPPLVITPTQVSNPVVVAPTAAESVVASPEPTETSAATSVATPSPGLTPTATREPEPTSTPTAVWAGTLPTAIVIPSIRLDAPVVSIGWKIEKLNGQDQAIWDVPDYRAAGWHDTSSLLGVLGNTVFNGHNTSKGEVFRYLYKLETGAQIFVKGADGEVYVYRVAEKYILREAGQPLEVRLENARYIENTSDGRLTLVTCHPYGSLANRLLIIAYPDESDHLGDGAS